jgi:hypothetical protein
MFYSPRFPASAIVLRKLPSILNRFDLRARFALLLVCAWMVAASCPALAGTATTTTLAVNSGGSAVTSVSSGAVVTLTATVLAGSTPVTLGTVKFCVATATYCEDAHIVGTAQLTSAGTAVVKFRPSVGSHSYNAVFLGTTTYTTSSSSASSLSVTSTGSLHPTFITGIGATASGTAGTYDLTAILGAAGPTAPTGNLSYLDTSNSDAVLDTVNLSGASPGISFLSLSTSATGAALGSIVVADFNGDGILDIAGVSAANTVSVYLGNGDGTFTAAPDIPVPYTSTSDSVGDVVTGDFNGDGIPDLAVVDYTDQTVTVFLGNGDGTFTQKSNSVFPIYVYGYANEFAVADFNRDGKLDLAVIGSSGILILLGNGDGTFTAAANSPSAGTDPAAFVVADFNGDGIPDLAVLESGYYGPDSQLSAIILLGNGDGTFSAQATAVTTPPANPYYSGAAMVAGDFNGDGKADLAILSDHVNIFLGNGNGTFTTAANLTTGAAPMSLAVGDFNGDGTLDLAVANTVAHGGVVFDNLNIFMGNGDGSFQSPSYAAANPAAGGEPTCLGVGDFNGDGYSDIAVGIYEIAPAAIFLAQGQTLLDNTTGVSVPPSSGPHQVEASYGGDSNYAASTSATTLLYGALTTPTVGGLSASPNPSAYGAAITFTATVTGSGVAPTGTVSIYNGPNLLCAGTISGASATCATSTLPSGSTYILASYGGDSDYNAANSTDYLVTVNSGASTTPPITWNGPAPITFLTALSSAQLDATSTVAGTFSYSPATGTVLPAGAQTLTTTFTPTDTTHYSTATASVTLTVLQATPSITWSTPAAITYGTALSSTQLDATSPRPGTFSYSPPSGTVLTVGGHTLTATFTPADTNDFTTATADVTIIVNNAVTTGISWGTPAPITYGTALSSTQLDATSLVAGTFSYSPASGTVLTAGAHTLTATFTPTDTTDYTTATASVTVTVNKATPGITLATSASSAYVTNPVTFTATLSSSASTPTGTVTFYDGTTILGTVTLSAGVATYSTSSLAAGSHSITAVYSGDSNFVTVTSSITTETIENFTIAISTGDTTSATASPGGQALYSFAVSPPSGTTFAGPVTFTVTGLPTGATATFSPNPVPAGAGNTTVTMTVTVPSTAEAEPLNSPLSGGALPVALGMILLPFTGRVRRMSRRLKGMVFLTVVAIAGAAFVSGCGGGSGSGSSTPPPQNYTLTVTGTSGSLSNNFTVTLTVE